QVRLFPVTPVFSDDPRSGAGEICRVYESTGEPLDCGVVQLTARDLSPKTSFGGSGVSGRTSGRAGSDSGDAGPSPTRLCATTWNVYSTLFTSPSRVHVVDSQVFEYGRP